MTALLLVEPSIGLPKIAMGQVLSTSLGLTTAHLAIGPALLAGGAGFAGTAANNDAKTMKLSTNILSIPVFLRSWIER
jgi:hypothetical protein